VTITPTTGYHGQTLTITSTSAFNGDTISMSNVIIGHDSRRPANVFWYEPDDKDYQNMVTFDMNYYAVDYASLSFRVNTGNLSIIKTTKNNNGAVAGFTFEVKNSSGGLVGTYTSTATGKIDIPNLTPGWYSVREINLSSDFVEPSPNPVNVEVKAEQTVSVSFDNVKKRGVITIKKINANPGMSDYSLAGAVFEIRDQGGTLVDTVTVPASGIGQSKVLDLGVYRITEKSTPPTGGFVRNTDTFTVALTGLQGTAAIVYAPDCVIPEIPQVARINLIKTNSNIRLTTKKSPNPRTTARKQAMTAICFYGLYS